MSHYEDRALAAYQRHYLALVGLQREASALLDRAHDLGLVRSARALDLALLCIAEEGNEVAARFDDVDETEEAEGT